MGEVQTAAGILSGIVRQASPEIDAEIRVFEVAMASHRGRYWEAALRFQEAAPMLRRDGMFRSLASGMLHAGIALAGHGDYVRAPRRNGGGGWIG
jgi:hypothetical protein